MTTCRRMLVGQDAERKSAGLRPTRRERADGSPDRAKVVIVSPMSSSGRSRAVRAPCTRRVRARVVPMNMTADVRSTRPTRRVHCRTTTAPFSTGPAVSRPARVPRSAGSVPSTAQIAVATGFAPARRRRGAGMEKPEENPSGAGRSARGNGESRRSGGLGGSSSVRARCVDRGPELREAPPLRRRAQCTACVSDTACAKRRVPPPTPPLARQFGNRTGRLCVRTAA